MKRIFIRSGMTPTDQFSISHCIAEDVYGSNTGNLLYAYSIYRALMTDADVEFEANYYKPNLDRAHEINETCQTFVIPLADAFRTDFVYELRNLTELVNQLTIPCVVTGVGLKAPYEPDFSRGFSFDDDVRAFVNAILDKSAILGLRGELTAEYLHRLGYREEIDYTVIGCPSMYARGGELSVKQDDITRSSKVGVNSSIRIPHKINDFVMDNMKLFDSYYFIPQQTSELRLAYAGAPYNGAIKYGNYPARITDPLFADDRYKAFVDVPSWLEYMEHMDFSFGGRLHGNVAATLAGIPSLVITSDARMRELSEYHGLAHVSSDVLEHTKDIFSLIEDVDFGLVQKKHKRNFEHFCKFLEMNELDNVYSRGLKDELPFDQIMQKKDRCYTFKNFALCDDREKLERVDTFYYDFTRVYSRYANGYKEMYGIHENDVRNADALKTEKNVLSQMVERYERTDVTSHAVIELQYISESELREFLDCIEGIFTSKDMRVIHMITAHASQHIIRMCRMHKSNYINYRLEDNEDPNLLRTQMYPYYYFEENMLFWEELFEACRDSKGVYIAFLSDFMWKTMNNVMWPHHYTGEQMAQARKRVMHLLDQIPDEIILRYKGVDNFHRFYLLGLKDKSTTTIKAGEEVLEIIRDHQSVYQAKKIEIVLTKFHPVGDHIRFVAFIKSPVFNFYEGKPILWMEENDRKKRRREITLKDSSWDYYKTKEKTNNFYTFVLNINTRKTKSFSFYVEIGGVVYDTYFYFMPEVVFNSGFQRYRYYRGNTEYRFDHNVFRISEVDLSEASKYRDYVSEQFKENEPDVYKWRYEIINDSAQDEKTWLYYDCKGVKKDNGYLQFQYDFDKEDSIKRYYILNNDIEECQDLFTKAQLLYVIPFGSEEHKRLYTQADKVITAYIEKNNYLPFTDSEYAKIMDVASMPEIIYLQHGVYHAYIPWKYSLDRLAIDRKVISTKIERKQDLESHCFTKKYEMTAGMPRYDFIDTSIQPQKKILYAPSWRKYLVDMIDNEWVTREDIFAESRFFKESSKLLQDEGLIRFLKRHHYKLEFRLHPILKRYEHLYHLDGEVVRMADEDVKEEDYAVMITDFSSYVYDFVYLERSILYFFPDYDEFRSGMSDYRECVLPFEDGLGELATNAADAVRIIKKIIRHGSTPEDKYREKMEHVFYHRDNKARKRIYEALTDGSDT